MSVFGPNFTDDCFSGCNVTDVLSDLQALGATGIWPGGRRPDWVLRIIETIHSEHAGETIALRWCIDQLDEQVRLPSVCLRCKMNSPGL